MEHIAFNGQIYFRKKFYPPNEEKRTALEQEFEDFLTDLDGMEKDIFQVYKEIAESYNNSGLYKGLDYENSDNIYELRIRNGEFYLVNISRPELREMIKVSLEKLIDDYVLLEDFIREAEFYGEEGHIENPPFHDIYGINEYNECVVLYMGTCGVLVSMGGDLTFLDERYVQVSWVLGGEKVASDKRDIYGEIKLQMKKQWDDYKKYKNEENA